MPLVGIRGEPGRQVLHYLRGPAATKETWWLRIVLLASAVFGFVSAADSLGLAIQLSDVLSALRDSVLETPLEFAPEERDVFRLLANISVLGILVGLLVTFGIPVRYLVLVFRVTAGSPNTWRAIRTVAWIAIAIEAAKALSTLIVSSDLEVLDIGYAGWPHVILAGALLWRIHRAPTRVYFSAHKVAKVPKDEQPDWEPLTGGL